jgi:hypothetical protein
MFDSIWNASDATPFGCVDAWQHAHGQPGALSQSAHSKWHGSPIIVNGCQQQPAMVWANVQDATRHAREHTMSENQMIMTKIDCRLPAIPSHDLKCRLH